MNGRRIVGIAMVRDEDVFVEQAVRNALEACDEFILVDHRSRDATPAILTRIRDELPEKVSFQRVRRAGEANVLLRRFVGKPVWVLAVDGDELYEPDRLALVRANVLRGDFDAWFSVKGNNLHCTSLDAEAGTATGYLAPPARSITKLFNFAAIESWTGTAVEHLYGGRRQLKPDYADAPTYLLRDEHSWAESPFRCLHVCFLPRSSQQPATSHTRRGVLESGGYGRIDRARAALRMAFGRPSESAWKLEKYRQGDPVTVDDVAGFFPQRVAST
jgi:glycosyltransferase involved in cell wall biosynthesis